MQLYFALSYWEIYRHATHEALNDRLDFTTEHRLGRATHSSIADERCPSRKNLFISRLDVGMRAHNNRNFPVQKSSHRDFLACRFRMHIHQDYMGFSSQPANLVIDKPERIFQAWLHKCPSLDVDHSNFPFGSLEDYRTPTRGSRRIVNRAQQTRFGLNVRHYLFLIPYMISACNDRDARPQKVNRNLARNPSPSCRILTIDNDKIDPPGRLELRHHLDHRFSPRFSNNVAEK